MSKNRTEAKKSETVGINEVTRKKSGSASALYLCDTAATKARKAELKQQKISLKEASVKLTNNLKSLSGQYQSSSGLNCNNQAINQVKESRGLNKRNSMTKKSFETLNKQHQHSVFERLTKTGAQIKK